MFEQAQEFAEKCNFVTALLHNRNVCCINMFAKI